jgi:hypothetical protein
MWTILRGRGESRGSDLGKYPAHTFWFDRHTIFVSFLFLIFCLTLLKVIVDSPEYHFLILKCRSN